MVSNGSTKSRSSLVESSSHRIISDDGEKHAEYLISLNRMTGGNVSLTLQLFIPLHKQQH